MNYWLFVTTPDNWEITKKTNLLGAPDRNKNQVLKVKKGDKCVIYIKQVFKGEKADPLVSGEYLVESEVYTDSKQVFNKPPTNPDETFPIRLKVKWLNPSTKPTAFKPLIPKLSLFANKKNWALRLKGHAVVGISEEDYKTIVSAL